jgi:hypothetical protein
VLNLGSSTLELTAGSWSPHPSFTINAGTSTIKMTDSSSADKTFAGQGKTYNNLWLAPGSGTGQFTITGTNTFNDLKDDGTAAHTIQFPASTTQTVSSFTVSGNSGQLISLRSSSSGSQFTLSKSSGSVVCDYLNIQDSNADGGATWTPGANSVNNGNNSGWDFPSVISESRDETTATSDSQSSAAIFPASRAETVAASDSESSVAVFAPSLAETAAVDDAQSSVGQFAASLAETASIGDSQTGQLVVVIAESTATASAEDAVATFADTVVDENQLTEFATYNILGILNDETLISEAQSSSANFVEIVAETTAVSESQSAQVVQITGSGVKRLSSAVDAKIDWLLVRQAIEGFYSEAEDLLVTLPEMQGLSPFQRAKLVDAIDSSKMMRAVRRHGVPLTDLYALIDEVKRKKQEEDDEEALYALLDVA